MDMKMNQCRKSKLLLITSRGSVMQESHPNASSRQRFISGRFTMKHCYSVVFLTLVILLIASALPINAATQQDVDSKTR